MRNGYEPGKTLIFNHVARREKSEEVDGINAYAPDILKYHEGFIESVRKHMLATVEVVWGAQACKRMKVIVRYLEYVFQVFIRVSFDGKSAGTFLIMGKIWRVTLFLEWDVASPFTHQSQRLKRIMVFVVHPQVFLHLWGKKHAYLQDLKLTVAGKIARVQMIQDFYQKKPWTSKNDFIRLICGKEAKVLERKAFDAATQATSFKKTEKIKGLLSLEQPQPEIFSTTRLKGFLEAGLSAGYSMDDVADADETGDFTYLPIGLQEWIACQQYIMFEGQSISTSKEILPFYERYCASSDDELLVSAVSPTDMILRLMEMQLEMLNNLTGGKSSIVD